MMDKRLAAARFDEARREAQDARARGDAKTARVAEEQMQELSAHAWHRGDAEGKP